MSRDLLEVSHLSVHFAQRKGWFRAASSPVRAVEDVTFSVAPREIVGVVGESGSGKSTLARAILRLVDATAGSVRFDGVELLPLRGSALRDVRRRMQVVFQDPYASLNPRMTAGANVAEGLRVQGIGSRLERTQAVAELLLQVGLPAAAADRFPHQFSGGQRQRIGIARALAVKPELIVADEPVSALDLSIQAQILNLLLEQQELRGLALLFIGHDLSVIRHFCDRIIVLYRGRIVEIGETDAVFSDPRHPYTRALIDSAPVKHPKLRRVRTTPPADLIAPQGAGCSFRPRCPYAMAECGDTTPLLRSRGPLRSVACIREELPSR